MKSLSISLCHSKTWRPIEMTVWDYDQRGCNDLIGCLRLGPNPSGGKEWMDSLEEEVKPWEEMLDHPGESVECCLDLIPSIRNLLTSKSCAPNRTQVASGSDANGREDSLLVPIPRDSDGESASHTPTHATLLENHEEDDSEEVCTEILYHLALHMHMIIWRDLNDVDYVHTIFSHTVNVYLLMYENSYIIHSPRIQGWTVIICSQ